MCGREFPNETIRVSSRGWCLNGCSSNHGHPFAFSLPAVLELPLPHVLIHLPMASGQDVLRILMSSRLPIAARVT
jgi:hypothetical protein